MVGPRGAEIVQHSDMILGLDPSAEFKDTSLVLQPGTSLITYTDGLLEQELKSGEQLAEEGILRYAATAYGKPDPVHTIINNVLADSSKSEYGDDILMFWLEREASRDRESVSQNPRWFSPFSEGAGSTNRGL